MRVARFFRLASVGTLVALSSLSCRAERTQIVVVIDTDYTVNSQLGSLQIEVTHPRDGTPIMQPIVLEGARERGCTDAPNETRYCVPLSILLVPLAGRPTNAPVAITVRGLAGSDPLAGRTLVSRSARLSFAQGQTLRLPMYLPRACEGVFCPINFTCAEQAQCVPVDQPPGVVRVDPTTGDPIDAAVRDAAVIDAASAETATRDASVDVAPPPLCADSGCPALNAIAAGRDFTCVTYANGRMSCWGANDRGQLGRGTLTPRNADGSGGLDDAQLVTGVAGATVMGLGFHHACAAVTNAGTNQVLCWGANRDRSLGTGSAADSVATPAPVAYFTGTAAPSQLSLGRESTYARVALTVLTWGQNDDRALGVGSQGVRTTPTVFVESFDLRELTARERGMCWISQSSTHCLGINSGQRFGALSAAGALVQYSQRVDAAFFPYATRLGPTFACGINAGRVACWGENRAAGALGTVPSPSAPATITAPQRVATEGESIADLAVGADFVLARTDRGAVYCWGSNSEGACAFGAQGPTGAVTPSTTLPRRIDFPTRFAAPTRAIAAGDGHACAIDASNVVWCWGRNENAQAGLRVTSDPRSRVALTPTPVLMPIAAM